MPNNGTSLKVFLSFFSLQKQDNQNMQNMQNMQNIQNMQDMPNIPHLHADSALQQSVDFSCILGHQFRRKHLQLSSSCFVHHKVEPPPVIWLGRAKKIPENSMVQLSASLEAHMFCSMEGALTCVRLQEPED